MKLETLTPSPPSSPALPHQLQSYRFTKPLTPPPELIVIATCFADVRKSAVRKAERGMPRLVYFFHASRTTFRGHFLVIAAWWLVQLGIDVYRFFSHAFKEDNDTVERREQLQLIGKRVYANTLKGGASLVFASIGAGIGATLFHPSAVQWIESEKKMVESKTNMDEKKKTGEQELSASSSTPPCINRLRKSYLV